MIPIEIMMRANCGGPMRPSAIARWPCSILVLKELVDGEAERDQGRPGPDPCHERALVRQARAIHREPCPDVNARHLLIGHHGLGRQPGRRVDKTPDEPIHRTSDQQERNDGEENATTSASSR